MQFIHGGAYNGKSKWVRENFLEIQNWIRLFDAEAMPFPRDHEGTVVMEGLEYLVLSQVKKGMNVEEIRSGFLSFLKEWKIWENTSSWEVIIIGSDITKGVVPMEEEVRRWRDAAGWVYQDVSSHSEKVFEIWFGLGAALKE